MISAGFSLFFSGISEIFRNFRKTLMICVPWVVLLGGLIWYAEGNTPIWAIVAWIASWLVLPGVAVPWHRYMLAENLDPFQQNAQVSVYTTYLVKWFLLSLITGVVLFMSFFVLGGIVAMALGGANGLGDASQAISSDPFNSENRSVTLGLILAGALSIYITIYLAHRLGYVLPHVAVSDSSTGFFDALMKTGPIASPLIVVSFLVTLAILVAMIIANIPVFIFWGRDIPETLGPVPFSLALSMYQAFVIVLQVLVGASIQTEIFRVADGIAEEERQAYIAPTKVTYRR